MPETSFRVVTYNTHRSKGMDWKVRPDRIIDVLGEIRADVVALQEIFARQIPYLTEKLGLPYVFGKTSLLRGLDYGNLTLSRFPIAFSRNFDISVPRRSRRGCLRTDLEIPGIGLVHLFQVHLGTSFFERRRQALKLLSDEILVNRNLAGPRLVLGDFNEWTRGLVSRMLSEQLESADVRFHLNRKRTYPGMLPLLHLDHIYYDPKFRLETLSLYRTPAAMIASDHLPLVGQFSWNHSPRA
ncbi:MAG: endonuclease/exonuclease/phosphatase family protein [Bryobacteraceae bacterium]